MRDQLTLVVESLRSSWLQVIGFLPRLLVALLLLIAGWLLARAIRWLAIRLMRLFHLQVAAERTGLDDFLLRGGVRFTIVTLVGQALYWAVILVFTLAAFDFLGLTMGPELMRRLGSAMPDLGAALMVLVFGSLAARFVRGLVEAYLHNIGLKDAATVGLLIHGALIAFVIILSLEQLGLAVTLLVSAFELAFGGLCLGLAIAFGFGGRRWAESILERTRSKR
jgi:hypothetical protein